MLQVSFEIDLDIKPEKTEVKKISYTFDKKLPRSVNNTQEKFFQTKTSFHRTKNSMSVLNLNTEAIDERTLAPNEKPFFLNFAKEMLHDKSLYREFKSTSNIPDEEEIRDTNRLTLPVIVAKQENQKAQVHYLCGFPHSLEFIEVFSSD